MTFQGQISLKLFFGSNDDIVYTSPTVDAREIPLQFT